MERMVSVPASVTTGVIQGCVISALLFPMYIGGIFHIINHGNLVVFADDIKFIREFLSANLNWRILNIKQDLTNLQNKCCIWYIQSSAGRRIFISSYCQIPPNPLMISDSPNLTNLPLEDLGLSHSYIFNTFCKQPSKFLRVEILSLLNRSPLVHKFKILSYNFYVRLRQECYNYLCWVS